VNDYHWLREAMEYNPDTGRNYEDIGRVLAEWYSPPRSYDDRTGIALVEFRDGARAALLAWHDTTGWDCRSGIELLPFAEWEQHVRAAGDPEWGDGPDGEDMTTEAVVLALRAQLASLGG
jgi:hypothetical protein